MEIRPFDGGVRVKSWSFEVNWISQCRYCSGKAAMHYCYGDASPCQTEVEPCHSVGNSQGGLKQGGHFLYFCGYRFLIAYASPCNAIDIVFQIFQAYSKYF